MSTPAAPTDRDRRRWAQYLVNERAEAHVYRDRDDAHFRDVPFAFERETRTVTSADTLTLRLAAGGGQAIRFVPR